MTDRAQTELRKAESELTKATRALERVTAKAAKVQAEVIEVQQWHANAAADVEKARADVPEPTPVPMGDDATGTDS